MVHETVPVNNVGSSAVGRLCWFEKFGAHVGPAGLYVTWQAISDGVAPFTDATVGDSDATQILVANGGAWHFDIGLTLTSVAAGNATTPYMTVKRNTDSVGPLYDLLAMQTIAAGDVDQQTAQLGLSFDVDLADNDVIQFHLNLPADVTVQNAVLTCRRHGTVA
jgi:hypothetical protein